MTLLQEKTRRRLLDLAPGVRSYDVLGKKIDGLAFHVLANLKPLSGSSPDRKLRTDLRKRIPFAVRDLAIIARVAKDDPKLTDVMVKSMPWLIFVLYVYTSEDDLTAKGLQSLLEQLGLLKPPKKGTAKSA